MRHCGRCPSANPAQTFKATTKGHIRTLRESQSSVPSPHYLLDQGNPSSLFFDHFTTIKATRKGQIRTLYKRVIGPQIIFAVKGSHRPSASILSQSFTHQIRTLRESHRSPLYSPTREAIVPMLQSFHNRPRQQPTLCFNPFTTVQDNNERTDPYFARASRRSPHYLVLHQRKPSTLCFNPFTTVHRNETPDPHFTRESSVHQGKPSSLCFNPFTTVQGNNERTDLHSTRESSVDPLSPPSREAIVPLLQSFHSRSRQRKNRSAICTLRESHQSLLSSPSREATVPLCFNPFPSARILLSVSMDGDCTMGWEHNKQRRLHVVVWYDTRYTTTQTIAEK
jgi:hypothetical protein